MVLVAICWSRALSAAAYLHTDERERPGRDSDLLVRQSLSVSRLFLELPRPAHAVGRFTIYHFSAIVVSIHGARLPSSDLKIRDPNSAIYILPHDPGTTPSFNFYHV